MIVRESISFQRGRDPKGPLGIGAWENIQTGTILQLISKEGFEDRLYTEWEIGQKLLLTDVRDVEDGKKGIDYLVLDDEGTPIGSDPDTWFMSRDFFHDYFDIIKL